MARFRLRHLKMSPSSQKEQEANVEQSLQAAKDVTSSFPVDQKSPLASQASAHPEGITFAAQDSLPKLPIPELKSSLERYLRALKPLQEEREHAETKLAVEAFGSDEGPILQKLLEDYASGQTSYIEQFCMP